MTTETNASEKAASVKGTAREEAGKAGETIAEEAKAVAGQAKELGREHAERQFEQGKGVVEGQVDAVGGAVGDAAERLRRENHPLASYAEELSGQLSRFSSGIENTSLDDLAVKTRRVARENPGLFMLGSVVAGLAAARFFKASAERERAERYGGDGGDLDYGSEYDYDYRSPTAGGSRPYRDSGLRGAESVRSAAGTSAERVPLDSGHDGIGAGGTGGSATTTGGATPAGTSTTTSSPAGGTSDPDNKGAN